MQKTTIEISGEQRGVYVDEQVDDRPLLLYIHGGPLFPELFLIDKYYPKLYTEFQCVFPETRGCGLNTECTGKELTIENLVDDIIEWAEYFLEKFNKKNCLIMGHSFGTVTASLAVKKRPELFSAYIGIGQVNSMYEHQRIVYEFVKECCAKENNSKFLTKFPDKMTIKFEKDRQFYMFTEKYLYKHRRALFHTRKYTNGQTIKDLFGYKGYSLGEKFQFLSVLFSAKAVPLLEEFMVEDYGEVVKELPIPMFIFNGKYDLMACPEQAETFYENVLAPHKAFYLYENSAHFPMFDEPEKFSRDIVAIKQHIFN